MAYTEKTIAPDSGESTTLDWFYGYGITGTVIEIETANFDSTIKPEVADIAVTTGDVREILHAILEHVYMVQEARRTAEPEDILSGMIITKANTCSGQDLGVVRTTFKVDFTRTLGDRTIEPFATPADTTGTPNLES